MLADITLVSDRWFSQPEFAALMEQSRDQLNHYELLNGRIVVNPPSGWPHGETEALIANIIVTFVRSRHLGGASGSSQGFELPSGDTVAPDVSFVSAARWEKSGPHERGKFLKVVPDLVVEILSASTAPYDRGEKKAIYQQNGVREYWIVDTAARRVALFSLTEAGYQKPRLFEEADTVESVVLSGLRFAIRDVIP
jgi:Uma2 family endonuclease